MDNVLFIGTSKEISLAKVLRDTCTELNQFGIQALEDGLVALIVENGKETPHDGGALRNGSYVTLQLKSKPTFVNITQFETEIVPGYSVITDPFTIGVGVWVGADERCRLLAACVAYAVAVSTGNKILDSEHKWSDHDLTEADEFISAVKRKWNQMQPR